jgi:excisionase family DNA binding protein
MVDSGNGRVPDTSKEILNTAEACRFLGTSRFTLLRLIAEEGLPALKLGRQWRFVRADLVAWLRTKRPGGLLDSPPKPPEAGARPERRQ